MHKSGNELNLDLHINESPKSNSSLLDYFVFCLFGVATMLCDEETDFKERRPCERAYFYNTHRFDLGGKWNVAKPLGGSTRWGHMTGGLTNHLSDL